MHVKLNQIKRIEVNGKVRQLVAGDWVSDQMVGKQTLLRWLADGSAKLLNGAGVLLPRGAGVLARGENADAAERFKIEPGIAVSISENRTLPFPKTLLWDSALPLNHNLFIPGFNVLNVWQIAVPLCDYDILASQLGDEVERDYTAALCCDELRIPVYDTRLMFVKRCETTQDLMDKWNMERQQGGDDRLAFLRALFMVKPLILALPYTWTTIGGRDKYEQ